MGGIQGQAQGSGQGAGEPWGSPEMETEGMRGCFRRDTAASLGVFECDVPGAIFEEASRKVRIEIKTNWAGTEAEKVWDSAGLVINPKELQHLMSGKLSTSSQWCGLTWNMGLGVWWPWWNGVSCGLSSLGLSFLIWDMRIVTSTYLTGLLRELREERCNAQHTGYEAPELSKD